jgi:hypothetical protein
MTGTRGAVLFGALCAGGAAQAQPFPAEPDWQPLYCRGDVMSDGVADEPDAMAERDLVGGGDQPAGLRALDQDYFYLRLRLDADPLAGGARPSAWGMAFDLDLDRRSYEILILADGIADTVKLFANSEIASPNDPTDPADLPPRATYAFADAARVVEADSEFGDDPDWFVDIAVVWDDLFQLDFRPSTPFYAWAASSGAEDRLDGDFACHDGSSGRPSLDDIASDPAAPDPDVDPDVDDPDPGPGERRLEGGGGCASGGGSGAPAAFLLLAGFALLRRARCVPVAPVARRASTSRTGPRSAA